MLIPEGRAADCRSGSENGEATSAAATARRTPQRGAPVRQRPESVERQSMAH